MGADAQKNSNSPEGDGLRSRKKAKRREDILSSARILFEQKGIQATTVADIAEAVDVSPPTVFNYFGNKDGILIALITEGSNRSRQARTATAARDDADFATILLEFLSEVSRSTLQIADKRVWRYAEAAAIRHPTTDLAMKYTRNDEALRGTFQAFLDQYDLQFRAKDDADSRVVARMLFELWNATFFDLIKNEDMTLPHHFSDIRRRVLPLSTLVFSDGFLKKPVLATGTLPNANR